MVTIAFDCVERGEGEGQEIFFLAALFCLLDLLRASDFMPREILFLAAL